MRVFHADSLSFRMFMLSILPVSAHLRAGRKGDGARGISAERFEIPLAGGGAPFAPWGEPSPPRRSPGGNGKGGSDSRCRRLFAFELAKWPRDTIAAAALGGFFNLHIVIQNQPFYPISCFLWEKVIQGDNCVFGISSNDVQLGAPC